MEYYSIGKFAKLIDKSIVTLRLWDRNDALKPTYITTSGHRMYSQEQLNEILHIKNKTILQGKKANKAKKLIQELKAND